MMNAPSTHRSAGRRGLAVIVAAAVLLLGPTAAAGAATALSADPALAAAQTAVLPTTSLLALTSSQYAYGHAARATVTVRDPAGHAPRGSARFALDGRVFATVALNALGRAAASAPANAGPGRHAVTATFVPAAGGRHSGSAVARAFDVLRANVNWGIAIPVTPVYGGTATIGVVVRGFAAVTGRVSLRSGGRVVQRLLIARGGTLTFRVPVTWSAGNAPLSVAYEGNATFAPSAKLVVVRTSKAPSTMSLSVPAMLGFATGTTAAVAVRGAGAAPTGRVTVSVDGHATSANALVNGTVALSVPAMSGGRHSVTTSYPGDANHSGSSRSTQVTAAANQCPVTARACVDLTHSLTWLQSGGRVTYGPVPIASGRPGYRTPAGTFRAYWKDINHHSSEFNNAPMPYSVFFNGGVAFHQGSLLVESHGCIHLTGSAARYYFGNLRLGDQVSVFGYAPY